MRRPAILMFSFFVVLSLLYLTPRAIKALSEWTVINTSQFGDANNIYIPSLGEYSGNLYAGTYNPSTGTEIWEYNSNVWSQVNTDGFGDANNNDTLSLYEHDNQLYAGTGNSTSGAEVWLYDGLDWTQINTDGFGSSSVTSVYDFEYCEIENAVFAATKDITNGGWVYYYTSGTTWMRWWQGGFGDSNNIVINSLESFDGFVYAATENSVTGTEIWKYTWGGWSQVNVDGFGDAHNESAVLAVYENRLYAGTLNTANGVEVWQYDGTDWTQVNTDGFGNASYVETYDMFVYNGKLYAGTNPWNLFEYNGSTWTSVSAPNNGTPIEYQVLSGKVYAGTGTGYVEESSAEADLSMNVAAYFEEVESFNIVYEFTIVNTGPDSANNVLFTASIPDGTTFVSTTGTGWSCGVMGQNISCSRPTLAEGETSLLTLIVHAEEEGSYEMNASITSDGADETPLNNTLLFTLDVRYLVETGASFIFPILLGSSFFLVIVIGKRKEILNNS